jgi:UDP-N-acetylmuramyl pentapeptide synthase
MFLTYDDLANLFPDSKGIKEDFLFYTVSTDASLFQPKGLFVPVFEDSGELKDAINNGAIGAIWNVKVEVPLYIPSQFPILYSKDLNEALEMILKTYVDKLSGENNEIMNMTKFLINKEKLLNEPFSSYDKPVLKYFSSMERGI